jgi:hypothetical protein
MAAKSKSSSPLSLSLDSSARKTIQSQSIVGARNNTRKKETRQEDKSSAKELFPSDVFEQREGRGEDESLNSEDCHHLDTDIDQLSKELELQESVIKAKEQELMKWQLILETQRENIDRDVKKWQAALADSTKASQEKHEEGIKNWQKVLTEATTKRDERYEAALGRWQKSFDKASTSKQLKQVKEAWQALESCRHAPTKEMGQASERLKQLEELANVPTKDMMEAKKMIEQLEQQRDTPTKDLPLPTKKEKKYVKDVMMWQDALADATAKHKKDCKKWEKAFLDSQYAKGMRQVKSMLQRLMATRELPTKEMEQAMEKLDQLEQEKDAHAIVMRYAASKVNTMEKELLMFKGDLNTTKKLIRQAEESFEEFSESSDGGYTLSYEEGEDMCSGSSWLCGTGYVLERSVATRSVS